MREVCWLLSNIAAGNHQQLETLINGQPDLLPKINRLAVGNWTLKLRKEAAWCLCNALTGSNSTQLKRVVEAGALPALATALYLMDEKLLNVCYKIFLTVHRLNQA